MTDEVREMRGDRARQEGPSSGTLHFARRCGHFRSRRRSTPLPARRLVGISTSISKAVPALDEVDCHRGRGGEE